MARWVAMVRRWGEPGPEPARMTRGPGGGTWRSRSGSGSERWEGGGLRVELVAV